jgi:hypothetical protein
MAASSILPFHEMWGFDSNVCTIIGSFLCVRGCTEDQVKAGLWRPKHWARLDIYEEVLRVCLENAIYPRMAQFAFERVCPYALHMLAVKYNMIEWFRECENRGALIMSKPILMRCKPLKRTKYLQDMSQYDTGYRRISRSGQPSWFPTTTTTTRKRSRQDFENGWTSSGSLSDVSPFDFEVEVIDYSTGEYDSHLNDNIHHHEPDWYLHDR